MAQVEGVFEAPLQVNSHHCLGSKDSYILTRSVFDLCLQEAIKDSRILVVGAGGNPAIHLQVNSFSIV